MQQIFEIIIPTPLGKFLAQATNDALLSLDFLDDDNNITQNENNILKETKNQLDEYFLGLRKQFTVPLLPSGTAFQKEVWKTLVTVNYGKTISYKEEAKLLGNQKAYRAVANANGQNPITIIIPCHRVIKNDGTIVGYSGGVWRKEFLLNLESAKWKK
jgi:methylated-DNA-[protein]-cysteine S-methyltransferase